MVIKTRESPDWLSSTVPRSPSKPLCKHSRQEGRYLPYHSYGRYLPSGPDNPTHYLEVKTRFLFSLSENTVHIVIADTWLSVTIYINVHPSSNYTRKTFTVTAIHRTPFPCQTPNQLPCESIFPIWFLEQLATFPVVTENKQTPACVATTRLSL